MKDVDAVLTQEADDLAAQLVLVNGEAVRVAQQDAFFHAQDAACGALLFLAALIFVVRPVAVFASTWRSDLTFKERLFLAWLAPRGIVAAAVAALFALRLRAEGIEEARGLAPLVFLVIIGTVAVYGITAAPLARRLGLAEPDPQGALIIGASRFARAVAQALAVPEDGA